MLCDSICWAKLGLSGKTQGLIVAFSGEVSKHLGSFTSVPTPPQNMAPERTTLIPSCHHTTVAYLVICVVPSGVIWSYALF